MLQREIIKTYAHRTIAQRAFHAIIIDRMSSGESLSVVRMGDGERQLFEDCTQAENCGKGHLPVASFNQHWRERMGIEGITSKDLLARMAQAIYETDYYGPSVSGFTNPEYNLYSWFEICAKDRAPEKPIVDNFFVNDFTDEQRICIYKQAKHVLFIHGNPNCANAFARRAKKYLALESTHLQLRNWRDAQDGIDKAAGIGWDLALVSAGPAGKWIIPELAKQGGVVLDLGNAADHWLLSALEKAS